MHENLHQHVLCISFLVLFLNIHYVKSEIQSFKISSDPRPFILFEDFGFNNPGRISLSVSSISITTKSIINPTESSLMGCFYAPDPARHTMKLALLNDICIIGKPFIFPIFTFNERIVLSTASINKTIPVTIPDLYFIFFVNCAKNASISMNVDLETYNFKPSGERDYIDEHLANLPSSLYMFSLLFFVFLLTWGHVCNKNKDYLHKIHFLMALLLFVRFLELLFYVQTERSIRLTGSPHGWNIIWLTVYFLRSILFVNVIMLTGAGWSLLRPCLQDCQKYTLAVAISFQVLASTCFILIRVAGPSDKNYKYWVIMYYSADFISCVTMGMPLLNSLDILGLNPKTEGKEARSAAELRVYGNYSIALFTYVGFTRLGMFMVRSMSSYRLWCVTLGLELAIELLFYGAVYYMFRPNERNDYGVPGDREEEPGSATSRTGV